MFGLWSECPEDTSVAWGARAIVEKNHSYDPYLEYTKDGKRRKRIPKNAEHRMYRQRVSLLHDRQDWKGEPEERTKLSEELNAGILKQALLEATRLFHHFELDTKSDEVVTLVERDGIKILANPRGSCGYLYMIAFRV